MALADMKPQFNETIGGRTTTRKMHISSCLEYVNTTVRLDTANRFLMRTYMTPADEAIIRKSNDQANSDTNMGVKFLALDASSLYTVQSWVPILPSQNQHRLCL